MIHTENIKYAAYLCSVGEEVSFVITKHNEMSLFLFCFYQVHYKTLKEFRHISFRKPKDLLYYFLKVTSLSSFGYYTLSFDYV